MCLSFNCSATSCKYSLASTGFRHPNARSTQDRCTCTMDFCKEPLHYNASQHISIHA